MKDSELVNLVYSVKEKAKPFKEKIKENVRNVRRTYGAKVSYKKKKSHANA